MSEIQCISHVHQGEVLLAVKTLDQRTVPQQNVDTNYLYQSILVDQPDTLVALFPTWTADPDCLNMSSR